MIEEIKTYDTRKKELIEEGNVLFKYNYKTNKYENNIEEAKTLDISKRTNKDISVLKYIYNNTLYWNELSPVKLLMEFVSNMLWFRSVRTNEFMGLLASNENINDFIIKEKLLPKFEKFSEKVSHRNECRNNTHIYNVQSLWIKGYIISEQNVTFNF